jgi:hypothetical protein
MKCPLPPPLSFQIVPPPFTGDTNVIVIDARMALPLLSISWTREAANFVAVLS